MVIFTKAGRRKYPKRVKEKRRKESFCLFLSSRRSETANSLLNRMNWSLVASTNEWQCVAIFYILFNPWRSESCDWLSKGLPFIEPGIVWPNTTITQYETAEITLQCREPLYRLCRRLQQLFFNIILPPTLMVYLLFN